jgi:RNA polymerase sigma factor (sigma-70 family)
VSERAESQQIESGDADLIQSCLAGDQLAWEELVDRYGRLVYAIPRRMGFSAADADDVFQDVFATLVRSLGSLRDQTRLAAWLITTTRRECWRRGKAEARVREIDLAETLEDRGSAPVEDIVRWEREQGLRQAMRRLDERCRSLLTALFLDPATPGYEMIAARLGMPIGSIGPTRARCFRKLDAILRELGFDGSA